MSEQSGKGVSYEDALTSADERSKRFIQWHPVFVDALTTALYAANPGRDVDKLLQIESEKALGQLPLRADMIITKKNPHAALTDAIGCFFRQCNIIEYKSQEDACDIRDLYKSLAYAYMLLSAQDDAVLRPSDMQRRRR